MMPTQHLPLFAVLLVASVVHADPAFEVPVVPRSLLDGGHGAVAGAPVSNGAWAQESRWGMIRTVGGRPGTARPVSGMVRTALEMGPRSVTVTPGTTVLIEIAIGHLNRIVTPFETPVVHTVSPASTQVDGRVVYVATDSEEPVALYVSDGQGSPVALSLTLAPRYVPPREIRLSVPGYSRKSAAAPGGTGGSVSALPALANADVSEAYAQERSRPYVAGIVDLLRAMAQGRMPAGYQVRNGAGGAKVRCAEGLKLRKTQLTEGPAASVVTAAVANTSARPVTLDQYACDIDNGIVAAVAAWPRNVLAPGQESEVFLVLAQGDRMREPTGTPR